jgi:hypothetical protein
MIDDIVKYQTVVTNPNVDLAELVVDPEAVKFEELNLPEDVEDEKAIERALGFIDPEPGQRRSRDNYDDEQSEMEVLRELVGDDVAAGPAAGPASRENAR